MAGTRITTQASTAHEGIPPGRILSGLTVLGVGALVVLVSLSLFRDLAERENERDAVQTLVVIGRELRAAPPAPGTTLREWLAERPLLHRQLNDRRWLDGGDRLLRHGYLFEWTHRADGQVVLGAWPWDRDKTGRSAYLLDASSGVWRHENGPGGWSGPESPMPERRDALGQWQRLGR